MLGRGGRGGRFLLGLLGLEDELAILQAALGIGGDLLGLVLDGLEVLLADFGHFRRQDLLVVFQGHGGDGVVADVGEDVAGTEDGLLAGHVFDGSGEEESQGLFFGLVAGLHADVGQKVVATVLFLGDPVDELLVLHGLDGQVLVVLGQRVDPGLDRAEDGVEGARRHREDAIVDADEGGNLLGVLFGVGIGNGPELERGEMLGVHVFSLMRWTIDKIDQH